MWGLKEGPVVTSVILVVHFVCAALVATFHCEDILVFCDELFLFIRNITLPGTSLVQLTHSDFNPLLNSSLYLCFLAGFFLEEVPCFFSLSSAHYLCCTRSPTSQSRSHSLCWCNPASFWWILWWKTRLHLSCTYLINYCAKWIPYKLLISVTEKNNFCWNIINFMSMHYACTYIWTFCSSDLNMFGFYLFPCIPLFLHYYYI